MAKLQQRVCDIASVQYLSIFEWSQSRFDTCYMALMRGLEDPQTYQVLLATGRYETSVLLGVPHENGLVPRCKCDKMQYARERFVIKY